MENFLLEHFKRQDKENTGLIKINELMISLKSCDKIKLSKV
jgi:Ca2+-binding EF-hand superfamily protein